MSGKTLVSKADIKSAVYNSQRIANISLRDRLRSDIEHAAIGGSARAREKHVARGKLLPRERIRRLLDPGSAFVEIGQLAAYGLYEDAVPGAGIVTGIGQVSGRQVLVVANDATVKGGTAKSQAAKSWLLRMMLQ